MHNLDRWFLVFLLAALFLASCGPLSNQPVANTPVPSNASETAVASTDPSVILFAKADNMPQIRQVGSPFEIETNNCGSPVATKETIQRSREYTTEILFETSEKILGEIGGGIPTVGEAKLAAEVGATVGVSRGSKQSATGSREIETPANSISRVLLQWEEMWVIGKVTAKLPNNQMIGEIPFSALMTLRLSQIGVQTSQCGAGSPTAVFPTTEPTDPLPTYTAQDANQTVPVTSGQSVDEFEQALLESNILLAGDVAKRSQVREWIRTDLGYKYLIQSCLSLLEHHRLKRAVHLDTLNGFFLAQFNVSNNQALKASDYQDLEKLQTAIYNHYNQMYPGDSSDFSSLLISKTDEWKELLNAPMNLVFTGKDGDKEDREAIKADSLQGAYLLRITFDLKGLQLLSGDASAVIFEQPEGTWRYISLDQYGENGKRGQQTVLIPLADFSDLDLSQPVALFHVKIWAHSDYNVEITSVSVK